MLLALLMSVAMADEVEIEQPTSRGAVLVKEFIQRVPVGRTYSRVQSGSVDPTPKRVFLSDPDQIDSMRSALWGVPEDPRLKGETLAAWPVRDDTSGALLLVGAVQSRDGTWRMRGGDAVVRVDDTDLGSTLR